ncbi:MAG: hypothetical protein ABJA86_06995 [Nocardioidaceae bacterium]
MKLITSLAAIASLTAAAAYAAPVAAPVAARSPLGSTSRIEPFCETKAAACPDTRTHRNYEGEYVGHDEPSVLFYSDAQGSGNSNVWHLRLPHESPTLPTQDGTGGTWNFQQHIAFWFGMALCETQSYPNPGAPCPRDSDANIKDSANTSSPNWIGNHAGTGFLELQFYPPGWTPFLVGTSCDPTKWCAAMAVFGLSDSLTQTNNADCLNTVGEEWPNFAFITKSGKPQAPPDPASFTAATFTPDPSKDLFMNAGDRLTIKIHDSAAGLVTAITDTTTGKSGSMTASAANGFAHPLFQPNAATCSEAPYSFHPMYSTSGEHTRVPWAAHSYNVAFSDEIGHFEYCDKANARGRCVQPGGNDSQVDSDDQGCFNADASLLIKIGGCIATDTDFDGTSYQRVWSGTLANATRDRRLHAESFRFTSPLSHGSNYSRVAFEADLPAIEAACDTTTGSNCVNPPPGSNFYPIYSTRGKNGCAWQEGGTHIPGTVRTFGGTSTTEYGPLIPLVYPDFPGFPGTASFFEDFRRVLPTNPCPHTVH